MSVEAGLRRAVATLVAAASLLLAWPVWQWTRADYLARAQPEAALALVPGHPEALEQAAANALARGDHRAAEAAARAALAARPLENRPYRLLAAIYAATGRDADARAAHRAAIALSPRNAASRLWLAERELEAGRYAAALEHLDWALRADPDVAAVVYPALAAGLEIEPFRDALAQALRNRPPWRTSLLRHLAERAPDLDAALPLFDALATDPPLPAEERAPWLARLEREQRWEPFNRYAATAPAAATAATGAAVAADASSAADIASDRPGLVDGDFEREPSGSGRDWRIGRTPGATITLSGNSGRPGGGRALTIEFADQRVPFDHVRQLLQLAPGRYELHGQARLDDLRSARGLRWLVLCLDGQELGRSEPFVGRRPWTPWAFAFVVPEGCTAQWLALRLDAVGPSEQLIGGSARFDALRIVLAPKSERAAEASPRPAPSAKTPSP